MKCKINNVEWTIKEVPNEEIKKEYQKYYELKDDDNIDGFCCYVTNEILLSKDYIEKRHVLYHELVHAYIQSVGFHFIDKFDEEITCDIASRSSIVINEIIDEYFKK